MSRQSDLAAVEKATQAAAAQDTLIAQLEEALDREKLAVKWLRAEVADMVAARES